MRLDFEVFQAIYNVAGSFQIDSDSAGFFNLRFGYGKLTDMQAIQQVLPEYLAIHEEEHEDDDCGWLYHYVIKHKGVNYG